MKRVGPRLRRHDDLASRLPSIFRRIGTGQYFEFPNGVQDRTMQRLIRCFIVVIDAIEKILIRNFAVAGDVEAPPETEIRALGCREHVRLEECELKIIAAVQWQFDNLFLVHDISDCGAFSRYQRRRGAHLHLFREGSYFQNDIEARLLIRFEHDAGTNHFIEAHILRR